MDTRKRGRNDSANGGFKKPKSETGLPSGGKTKPCTKFFSTIGCPFGEDCHFLHFFPGGYNAVAQAMNLAPISGGYNAGPPTVPNGSSTPSVKSKMCTKYNTAEGCKFGGKCNFAHGEWELGKPIAPSNEDPRGPTRFSSRFGSQMDPPAPPPGLASTFGASSTAKVSVDASLAGAIIGKGGVNSKQICRQTGAKLSIRDHETDPNLRNIELEGTFEQIQEASAMVRELIVNLSLSSVTAPAPRTRGGAPPPQSQPQPRAPASNFKTKACDNFAKGSCTFGERCHFAHGAAELRKSGM